MTVVIRVLEGDRPPRPDAVSRRVWRMVKACWRGSPSRRMVVGQVVALLDVE